ncbi:MAG: pyridoxal phosphate-dependent aminotransferase family protein, partial [Candidatus Caldatribacteriota bacterium]|nr:pyridoxal phosphate-dependent aminotransferase family protein [Candidatus Caldatribacteriota bacterium]
LEEKINKLKQRVERMKKKGTFFYLKNIEDGSEPRVFIDQKEKIMLASYNYLGLINHPKLKEAAIKALEKYGTGTAGVRLLSGTTKLHEELEAKIAEFKSAEDAITYTSGYVTNLAVITSLYQKGDLVIIDKIDHASIIDGCILSGARFKTFLHNNMQRLEDVLINSEEYANKIIVVDGVYSMEGDVANLPEISRLAKKYNAKVMVDEAHSIGVLGKTGHGIEEYFGLKNAVDIHMGTLSKTIPSVGGYIAGNKDMIDYLKHNSRPFIFSAPLPPVTAAVAKASLEVIEDEPERIENLQKNMKRFKEGIDSMGYNTGGSVTAIVPLIVGGEEDTLELCKMVNDEGVFICPILFPAIPKGTNRLRAHVLTTHTSEDVDKALDIFERAGKKLGLI